MKKRAVGSVALLAGCMLVPSACSSNTSTPGNSSAAQSATESPAPSNSSTSTPPVDVPKSAYNKWAWFKDTYWIVPPNGIYSVSHSGKDPGSFEVLRGQTVFHITDYFNGYWTGAVVVKITGAQVPNCQYVLGQVTPSGQVYMTMYDTESGEVVNNPVGTMEMQGGQWTMVNTMTAPTQSGGTISHWAYMVQSKEGQPSFASLPLSHESVPDFMASCPTGPPIKVGR